MRLPAAGSIRTLTSALPPLACVALAAAALPAVLPAQEIPETEIWLEPLEGTTEATWSELREQGLTLVVDGASEEAELFPAEGLILMVVRMSGGQPAGGWRSRRITSVPGGTSSWSPEFMPDAELGEETFRVVPGDVSIPSTAMMDGSEEGMAAVLRSVENAGGDPGSFVALFPLPLEPAAADRTRVRVLLGLPR